MCIVLFVQYGPVDFRLRKILYDHVCQQKTFHLISADSTLLRGTNFHAEHNNWVNLVIVLVNYNLIIAEIADDS